MIYIITGQTATGKTKRAIELAQEHNGELINCDSRQIYKKLDIITGKDIPPNATFNVHRQRDHFDIGYYLLAPQIPIWLYDAVDPKYPISIHDYRNLALTVIQDIQSRGKTPIIVGGSYLYIHNLLYNMIDNRVEPDVQLRKELEHTSVPELQKMLSHYDPHILDQLNNSEKNNPQRLIRKIEIAKAGDIVQKEFSFAISDDFAQDEYKIEGYRYADKEVLKQQITKRVEMRLSQGAIEEVQLLLNAGYTPDDPGLRTIGYSQIIQHLHNITSYEAMKNEWILKEIQYAKRQITFMNKNPYLIWTIL